MIDLLIVGAGVIGLSLAYEAACAGMRAKVIDRGEPGREASWAGAGILPPAPATGHIDSYARLAVLANTLHPQWAARLREETGIDNGFCRCGGIYLDPLEDCLWPLAEQAVLWRGQGIRADALSAEDLRNLEPALASGSYWDRGGWLLSDECQLRNPWHLKALLAACTRRGVEISARTEMLKLEIGGRRARRIRTSSGDLEAGAYCLTTGAWTAALLGKVQLAIRPVRGQMVLFSGAERILDHIINVDSRYLVPRTDGRVLVGSTEEEAGFEKVTTPHGIDGLLAFANKLAPELLTLSVEMCWAGLRPATRDGLPYLGGVPGVDNAFVAAGHFRSGLWLSPATAVVMHQLIAGHRPQVELTPFRLDRSLAGASG